MDTLRSFVAGIKSFLEKSDKSEVNTKIWSKPDGVSEIYETRRLTLSASRNRPTTDFYEFYWAHNMRNTSFADTSLWLWKLITTSPKKIPQRLHGLWYTIWGLMLMIICAIFIIFGVQQIKSLFAALIAIPFVLTLFGLAQKYFAGVFLSFAGDAARYFTPIPSNIEERNKIRQQGVNFLKKLHEKDYDRIVLVGHSLGSVIAYDLLRLLWAEYHDTYEKHPTVNQELLKEINRLSLHPEQLTDINAFQNLQYRCWMQQKETGNKWLVSDLVTLGAAVCCADYFMVSLVPFSELAKEKEYPVCPPVTDINRPDIASESRTYDIPGGQKRTVKILHHAALFAITRWTNIFFKSDFVGSEACRLFGKGVMDVTIPRRSLWFLPGGHTNYWDKESSASLEAIARALRLREDSNPEV